MNLVFKTPGLIELDAVTTMGISVKECENPIGYFGTGLKYAIAITLRLGGKFTLFRGLERFDFTRETKTVRGKDFSVVCMNGRPLGFTTDIGKNWESWMAFREVYCNTLDEGGTCFAARIPVDQWHGEEGHTHIWIDSAPMHDAYCDLDKIILQSEPIATTPILDVHPGPSEYIYYRNVKVAKLERFSEFTYNLKRSITLTEDRTMAYPWMAAHHIAEAMTVLKDTGIIRKALTSVGETLEKALDFNPALRPAETFMKTLRELRAERNPHLNTEAVKYLATEEMAKMLEVVAPVKEEHAVVLDWACNLCESIGHPVREYPIIVTDALGENTLGRAHDGKIYITERCFNIGPRMVATTLLEEFIHLRHGHADCSYGMQNYLFDLIGGIATKGFTPPPQ